MISSMTADLSVIVATSFFIAGIIKGVIGIGLPTTALTLLTLSVSPLEAIGLNVMPMVITNLYQLFRAENIKQLFSSYWRFASILIIFMTGSALLAASLGNDIIRLMIALSILAFTLNQLFGHALYLPSHLDRLFQYVLGGLAGIIGGLTSTWGVPITIYLVMKNVSPRQFIDATGFLITAGCVPIIFGYSMTSVFHFGILAMVQQVQRKIQRIPTRHLVYKPSHWLKLIVTLRIRSVQILPSPTVPTYKLLMIRSK